VIVDCRRCIGNGDVGNGTGDVSNGTDDVGIGTGFASAVAAVMHPLVVC